MHHQTIDCLMWSKMWRQRKSVVLETYGLLMHQQSVYSIISFTKFPCVAPPPLSQDSLYIGMWHEL